MKPTRWSGTPDRTGKILASDMEPEETTNYELGTKWDVFNDRLSSTAAIFRTEKENTRSRQTLTPTRTPAKPASTHRTGSPPVKSPSNGKCLRATPIWTASSAMAAL